MLTEKKKAYFRKVLNQRLEDALAETDRPISEIADLKEASPDFVDQATSESDLDFTLHIRERKSKLVMKIREAIERLENGTYGICEECGGKITEKRLKARPVTTLCIQCKKKQEAHEKLRGL
jgi:DnaK suppressor protein